MSSLPLLYRDIKCANILVHANGSVKLADFGLAKEVYLFSSSILIFDSNVDEFTHSKNIILIAFVSNSDKKVRHAKIMQRKCLLDGTRGKLSFCLVSFLHQQKITL